MRNATVVSLGTGLSYVRSGVRSKADGLQLQPAAATTTTAAAAAGLKSTTARVKAGSGREGGIRGVADPSKTGGWGEQVNVDTSTEYLVPLPPPHALSFRFSRRQAGAILPHLPTSQSHSLASLLCMLHWGLLEHHAVYLSHAYIWLSTCYSACACTDDRSLGFEVARQVIETRGPGTR